MASQPYHSQLIRRPHVDQKQIRSEMALPAPRIPALERVVSEFTIERRSFGKPIDDARKQLIEPGILRSFLIVSFELAGVDYSPHQDLSAFSI
jgi:hypothetical protein